MAKKTGLAVIQKRTKSLWYKVNEKFGDHKYMLGVNGLDQVVLSKGYTEEIAKGTAQVNAKLKELLEAYGGHNMDMSKRMRLNELAKDFDRCEVRRTLMREFGESETAYSGVNADGEDVLLSIFSDRIIVSTNQRNGWVRVNFYDADGYAEGETFKGRWAE